MKSDTKQQLEEMEKIMGLDATGATMEERLIRVLDEIYVALVRRGIIPTPRSE